MGVERVEIIYQYEEIFDTPAIYAMERIIVYFWLNRAYSTKVKIDITCTGTQTSAELKFFIPFDERSQYEDQIIAAKARFWEPEVEMRIETQSSSARLYRSGIKMTVSEIKIDEF